MTMMTHTDAIAQLKARGLWTDSTIDDIADVIAGEDIDDLDNQYLGQLYPILHALRTGVITFSDLDLMY